MYRYALEKQDYSIFASGQVFYSLPGQPAFPVRLASEIFQRCVHLQKPEDHKGPLTIFDPCCGGAYHLGVLAYLHWGQIGEIIASDVDAEALDIARRNLSLLTRSGLSLRKHEINLLYEKYGKASHLQTLQSMESMSSILETYLQDHPIKTRIFQADVMHATQVMDGLEGKNVDFVITDIPYGWHSQWQSDYPDRLMSPVDRMLDTLLELVPQTCIIAVAADKKQKITHQSFTRLDKFQIGRRRVVILTPTNGS
jgi:hypothetical protein